MLIDRTHRSWAMISTVILALGSVSYIMYAGASDKGATGGSLPGLIYGAIGTAMMVFAGLLAARKKVSFWRLGSAQFWLRGHLWFGGLSFPFILFHSGFGFGGLLEQVLMWIFVAVWLSGFYGLAMQHILPKLLTSRVERETFLAQVPYIRRRNRIMSDRMVYEQCGPIPLENDPMQKELERLIRHGKKVRDLEEAGQKDEAREEKTRWIDHSDPFDLALFRDIATISKSNGWIRTVNDLTPYMFDVYSLAGVTELKELPEADTKTESQAVSPLDQIKLGGAGKPGSSSDGPTGSPAGPDLSSLSVAQQIRARGAFGSGGSAVPAAAAPAAGGNPLDMIRAQGAFGSGGAAVLPTAAPAAARKPKDEPQGPILATVRDIDAEVDSISEFFEQKYGYTRELATTAAARTKPFLQLRKPNPNTPAPIPHFVPDIDEAVLSIEKFFIEKYGYDPSLAAEVSSSTRPFLKPDDEDPDKQIASIQELLVQKYGYDPALAEDVAERVRPYVDGTAEAAMAEAEARQAAGGQTAPAAASAAAANAPAGPQSANPVVNQIRAQGAFGSDGVTAPAAATADAAPKP
ncbi:MAG: hypothetical protein VB858_13095, partial [Planctomycetaceae bacterium]